MFIKHELMIEFDDDKVSGRGSSGWGSLEQKQWTDLMELSAVPIFLPTICPQILFASLLMQAFKEGRTLKRS